ncbi:MAG: hypothetical protein AB1442_16195 [Nitrospirota bacterium]
MTMPRVMAAKCVDTSLPDEQCDWLVYGLYGLTEKEIAIIEGRE